MSSERKDYAELTKVVLLELFAKRSSVSLVGTYAMAAAGEPTLQFLDANGAARNVKLPTETGNDGKILVIFNPTGAANSLTLQDSGGNALSPAVTVAQNKAVVMVCDGTKWRAIVGA